MSGVIYVFTKTYKDEKKEKQINDEKIADEIGNVYKTFFDKEAKITKNSDELYTAILDYSAYFEDMNDGYKDIVKKIDDYQNSIKEIEDISSYLKEKCVSSYSVASANDKCNAYYINLERTINNYVGTVKFFNIKIGEYNEWTKKENGSVGATVKYNELSNYVSSYYNDYVDLNNDGTFLGMNND